MPLMANFMSHVPKLGAAKNKFMASLNATTRDARKPLPPPHARQKDTDITGVSLGRGFVREGKRL